MKTFKALIARSNCEPQMGSMQEAKGKGRRQKSRHGRMEVIATNHWLETVSASDAHIVACGRH